MFARSGRGSVPIHKGQEKRRGGPEATPAPSRRSNWGRVISLPRSTIALKTPSWFNRFAIDRTSRRAAGLRTTCDRRTDIGIGRFSAVVHLLGFARKLVHQLRRPGQRFALLARGDSLPQ